MEAMYVHFSKENILLLILNKNSLHIKKENIAIYQNIEFNVFLCRNLNQDGDKTLIMYRVRVLNV